MAEVLAAGVRFVLGIIVFTNTSAAASGIGEVRSESARLATTAEGREVTIQRLTSAPEGQTRPAWVVVAGIDPRMGGSVHVAEGVVQRLRAEYADAFEYGDVYVVAALNPDGLADQALAPKRETPCSRAAAGTIDADRDGRFNEDGPVDLDGDGRVLWMRVKNPPLSSGLRAEWVSEANDPRVLRRADAGKGERGVYALLPESRDADGDGQFGEDGFNGVELDRNFPYHWPEFRDEAGRTPLSVPETRGLADWIVAHPNVVGVVVFGAGDTLVNVPPGGKMDETGESPATNHVLDADRGVFERVGEKFREITRQKESPARDNEGTLRGWAYAQMGLWSFSTPVWVRPDQLKSEEKKEETGEKKADAPAAEDGKAKSKKVDSEEGKWIAFSDARAAAGKEAGFVDWKPFKHPQLGEVEIGGFVPGFRFEPPEEDIGRLADEQTRFIVDLLKRAPRLAVHPAQVERLGSGTWRVRVEAVNEGGLPTRTAMGVKTKRLPPTRWTVKIEPGRLLAGDRTVRMDAVPAGGEIRGAWTFTGAAGDHVKVVLDSPECGVQEIDVILGEKSSEEGTR